MRNATARMGGVPHRSRLTSGLSRYTLFVGGELMDGTFVIEVGKTGKFRFNLRSGNHQVILTSQTYDTKAAAQNGIESVRKNATDGARVERKTAKDGSPYFVIKAKNGETIGKSEMYASTSGMENGIKSVAANAAAATIVDRTS